MIRLRAAWVVAWVAVFAFGLCGWVRPRPARVIRSHRVGCRVDLTYSRPGSYLSKLDAAEIIQYGQAHHLMRPFPFDITMPCGRIYTVRSAKALESLDRPCDCGNPDEWIAEITTGLDVHAQ